MFTNESWMNIFFKFLNFGALIALLVFIFRRYILPGVVQEIAQEKQQEIGMRTQVIVLDEKGKELASAAISQEHETRVLLDRAQQWQAVFMLEQEKQKHAQQVLYNAALVRKQQQVQAVESEKLMKLVLPQVVEQTRCKLIEVFDNEARGHEYVHDLLAAIKKSL